MTQPPMAKSITVWLIENTSLTFEQIANFAEMHPIEVQALADDDSVMGIKGINPINMGIVTKEDIHKAEKNPKYIPEQIQLQVEKKSQKKYTPWVKRNTKPSAIAWLLTHHPELSERQIIQLIGTTTKTIRSIKDRTYWNMAGLNPRSPVDLYLTSMSELQNAIDKANELKKKQEKTTV